MFNSALQGKVWALESIWEERGEEENFLGSHLVMRNLREPLGALLSSIPNGKSKYFRD